MRVMLLVCGLIVAVMLNGFLTGCSKPVEPAVNGAVNIEKPSAPPVEPAANNEAKATDNSEAIAVSEDNKSDASKINWLTDFKKGQAQAASEKKPILLDLGAEWCSWCKVLDQDTWSDKQVIAKAQEFVCIKVDIDVDPETAQKFEVQGVPAIILLDTTGKQVARNDGFLEPADMLKLLDKMPG